MACEWRSKVDPYVDSELSNFESEQMQSHLLACPSCASEAISRLEMKRAVRRTAVATFSPSPQFRLKVQSSVAQRKLRRRWFLSPSFAYAAVAVAVLIVAAIVWQYRPQRPDTVGELADLHVATLASANPVDVVSTDRHTVKPWFAGKLPFTFNLPELEGTPYRLIGGRVAYINQAPGAQLLFSAGKHQVSVFILQDRNGLEKLGSTIPEKNRQQFSLNTWSMQGLRYFVISDAGNNEINGLVQLLKSAASS